MQLPSESTYWSWALRGLGGLISIFEGLAEHGPRLSEPQEAEFVSCCERLYNVASSLSLRRIDKGAEYHGPSTDPFAARTTESSDDT